jgi:hypothetical protein
MAGIAVLLKHHSRRVSSLPAEPLEEGVDERRGAATDVDDVVVGPRNSTGVFEFCSGLVDLVVGIGRHRGGGHRLTLAGERFVGLVAEDLP